jgi:hypothetical protein
MRRGVRIPAWYLLLLAVLGILSRCQSLRDLERFAIPHHGVLTEALGLDLRRPAAAMPPQPRESGYISATPNTDPGAEDGRCRPGALWRLLSPPAQP